jgi:DNA modification methylase
MKPFQLATADCLDWLHAQADDSIDLLLTSPPFEKARSYGIDFDREGEAWVRWMFEVVTAAAPKVKGLIAVNCEGMTTNHSYSCVPELLTADLKRAGFNLRKTCVYHKNGAPGTGGFKGQHEHQGGGPDWLRDDWEPVICITRPGKLPWADGNACGHRPKYAPGGENHRHAGRNQWGGGRAAGVRVRDVEGVLATAVRPSHRDVDENPDEVEAIANPGNVIRCYAGGRSKKGDRYLADKSEAPMPVELAEFFVRAFCRPGGVVADPFMGTGTTGVAALKWGRRFTGCDIRPDQVRYADRRLRNVSPSIFV